MNQQSQLATMLEARREKRHVPTQTVVVRNAMTGQELGNLANITSDGLMLVSKSQIEADRIYQVSIQLPFAAGETTCVDIVIDCLWSKPADSQLYWAGCSIIDADDIACSAIDTLIESYSE